MILYFHFLVPDVNWSRFSIQRDGKFEVDIATICNFETSSSKRFSIEKYASTKLRKKKHSTSRVQLLVENVGLQMATNIESADYLTLVWCNILTKIFNLESQLLQGVIFQISDFGCCCTSGSRFLSTCLFNFKKISNTVPPKQNHLMHRNT